MVQSPFATAIEVIRKPLVFAAKDDFAGLERLRNLEASVLGAVRQALELAIPRDAREALRAVERSFAAPLEGSARRQAVRRVLAMIR